MKDAIRLTRLAGQPPETVATHFITPVRVNNSDELWSATIYWGRHDSKNCGDLIELELIFPAAPELFVGDTIEIFGGDTFEAFGEVASTD